MGYRIVVMGVSLGGLRALQVVLGGLTRDFPLPIAVVQHRVIDSSLRLRSTLQQFTAMRVREPQDKETMRAGTVYVAPADYHLLVDDAAFALSVDNPVNAARPSIDVLFESAADCFGAGVIAVVLTGASCDGARGAARVKAEGGYLIVQDPASAECAAMPRAALTAAKADASLPLAEIASHLLALLGKVEP
ncbi:MAG TPA: chemotaxis protein CheB [Armatimonadota bacterium]|nr:chemotaxis protein CheB [Armatimonadota bacterium]